jgi:type 1 glutamine amidotransferase
MFRSLILIVTAFLAVGPTVAQTHRPAPTYDKVAPVLPEDFDGAVLITSKTNGWRHIEHIPHSNVLLAQIAENLGRRSFVTENAAVFNDAQLRRFAVVVLNSTTGDFLTSDQGAALARFVAGGGGVVALHGAGDSSYAAPWYVKTITGARFIGHPNGKDQFQTARVTIAESDHPVMAGVRLPWSPRDEWYSFSPNPAKNGMTVLARIDETSYRPGKPLAMGTDHPVIWVNPNAGGRVFYSALGHTREAYDDPNYRLILTNAIRWAAR